VNRREILTTALAVAALVAIAHADTLTLRDGRRVQGRLVGIRDGVIEFEARRGGVFGARERMRLDRDEVTQIDFEQEPPRVDADGGVGRPSGLRERDVRVDARSSWTDTTIQVRPGQTVYFSARGRVRWGPGRQDGPAGERNSPRNDGRPIGSRPAAALIGRVGDDDAPFFIGGEEEGIRMRAGGRLFLGINDDYLEDNAGAFDVTIAY